MKLEHAIHFESNTGFNFREHKNLFEKASLDVHDSKESDLKFGTLVLLLKSTGEKTIKVAVESLFDKPWKEVQSKYSQIYSIEESVFGPDIGYFLSQLKPKLDGQSSSEFNNLGKVLLFIRDLMERYFTARSLVESNIHKTIEFSPEHKQAGLQILNYFQETLNQKYPDNQVTVRIGQKGNMVTMEIETPDGNTELYEKALEEYGLVVTGEKPVEEYLENPVDRMELKHQLQMANMQLEHKRDMITMKDQVIGSHERTIDGLNEQILKLTSAYINLSERLADITEKAVESDDMQPVFTILDEKLKSSSIEDFKEELEVFKAEKPTLWGAIQTHAYKIAEKAVYTQGSIELINLLTQI